MAKMMFDYPGYTEDLKRMLEGFDTRMIIGYQMYVRKMAKNAPSGSQQAMSLKKLFTLFDVLAVDAAGDGFVEDFKQMLPSLETHLNEKREGKETDDKFEDMASGYEQKLFYLIETAGNISAELDNYNRIDGYENFNKDESVQELFRGVKKMADFSVMFKMCEVKNIKSRFSRLVMEGEKNRTGALEKLKKMIDGREDLSYEAAEKKIANCKKELKKAEAELEKYSSEKYKEGIITSYKNALLEIDKRKEDYELEKGEWEDVIKKDDEVLEKLSGILEEERNLIKEKAEVQQIPSERKKAIDEHVKEKAGELEKSLDRLIAERIERDDKKEENRRKKGKDTENEKSPKDIKAIHTKKKNVMKEYFTISMNCKKWERTKSAFDGFVEKYQNEEWFTPEFFRAGDGKDTKNKDVVGRMKEAQKELGMIVASCPEPNVFKFENGTETKVFLSGVSAVLEKKTVAAQDAVKNNPSVKLSKDIKKMEKELIQIIKKGKSDYQNEARDMDADSLYNRFEELRVDTISALHTLPNNQKDVNDKGFYLKGIRMAEKRIEKYKAQIALNDSDHCHPDEIDDLVSKYLEDTGRLRELVSAEVEARFGVEERERQINDLDVRIQNKRREAYQYGSEMRNHAERLDMDELGELDEEEYKEEPSSIQQGFETEQNSIEDVIKDAENVRSRHKKQQEEFMEEYMLGMKDLDDLRQEKEKDLEKVPILVEQYISGVKENRDNKEKEYENAVADFDEMGIAYKEYCAYRNCQKQVYEEFEGKTDNEMLFGGFKEAVGRYESIFSHAMKEDHRNSREYDEIHRKLNACMNLKGSDTMLKLSSLIDDLYDAAGAYLKQKEKQWRLFPSNQRTFRLNYAKSIQSFCREQREILFQNEVNTWEVNKTFLKKAGQMNKRKPLTEKQFLNKDFFKKYSYELDGKPMDQEVMNQEPMNEQDSNQIPLLSEKNVILDLDEVEIDNRYVQKEKDSLNESILSL